MHVQYTRPQTLRKVQLLVCDIWKREELHGRSSFAQNPQVRFLHYFVICMAHYVLDDPTRAEPVIQLHEYNIILYIYIYKYSRSILIYMHIYIIYIYIYYHFEIDVLAYAEQRKLNTCIYNLGWAVLVGSSALCLCHFSLLRLRVLGIL